MLEKEEVLNKYDGDVYLYFGDISRKGYHLLSDAFEAREDKKERMCLILATRGGDPDAAYRMARAANHHYKVFEILVPDICKSAGTLLCVGSHKLIFGDRGELGPLDIQISKPDEMFESMSGMNIIQALSALQNQILESFRNYLVDIRNGSRIRTKTAAEIAIKLAEGFISPISAKIDPVTLGEHQRAMQIGFDYGERLDGLVDSLKPDALVNLVSGYPSHGFVIDRKEASELFNHVDAPNEETIELYLWARVIIERRGVPEQPIVLDLAQLLQDEKQQNELENPNENEGTNEERIEESEESSSDGEAVREGESDEQDDVQST